jgi:hypothetical protein
MAVNIGITGDLTNVGSSRMSLAKIDNQMGLLFTFLQKQVI